MNKAKSKQSILVVDDIPTNIKVLGESLRETCQVRIATNGERAIEIACSANPPDLILLDIMMPGMDGYETCSRLKAEKQAQNIPVIFITAKDQEEDETRGLEVGAVDYIVKPFSLPIVHARIRTHLELKQHRDLLEKLSAHDGLTGIPNRRRFDETLALEWRRSGREAYTISLIMIDIDHFKAYNDNYGHTTGDECLRQVAGCLFSMVNRPGDLMARYGGEEFACILPITGLTDAARLAEKMKAAVEALDIPHLYSPTRDKVTISLGVATVYPVAGMKSVFLVEGADDCLYRAKSEGRNRVISRDLNLDVDFVERSEESPPG